MVLTINDTNINTKYTEQKRINDNIIICSSDESGTIKAADTMFTTADDRKDNSKKKTEKINAEILIEQA